MSVWTEARFGLRELAFLDAFPVLAQAKEKVLYLKNDGTEQRFIGFREETVAATAASVQTERFTSADNPQYVGESSFLLAGTSYGLGRVYFHTAAVVRTFFINILLGGGRSFVEIQHANNELWDQSFPNDNLLYTGNFRNARGANAWANPASVAAAIEAGTAHYDPDADFNVYYDISLSQVRKITSFTPAAASFTRQAPVWVSIATGGTITDPVDPSDPSPANVADWAEEDNITTPIPYWLFGNTPHWRFSTLMKLAAAADLPTETEAAFDLNQEGDEWFLVFSNHVSTDTQAILDSLVIGDLIAISSGPSSLNAAEAALLRVTQPYDSANVHIRVEFYGSFSFTKYNEQHVLRFDRGPEKANSDLSNLSSALTEAQQTDIHTKLDLFDLGASIRGELLATVTLIDTVDVTLPNPGGSGVELTKLNLGAANPGWVLPDDPVAGFSVDAGANVRLVTPRLRPHMRVNGYLAESWVRPMRGTSAAAIPSSTSETDIALATGFDATLAVGDKVRINNEVMQITAVAVDSNGNPTGTYTFARAVDETSAASHLSASTVYGNDLAKYDEVDFEYGPGNIFNQGLEGIAVSPVKMAIGAAIQLRYYSKEREDLKYIGLFTRGGIAVRGSEIRLYLKVEARTESLGTQQQVDGIAHIGIHQEVTLHQYALPGTVPADPTVTWNDDGFIGSFSPWYATDASALAAATGGYTVHWIAKGAGDRSPAGNYTYQPWDVFTPFDVQYSVNGVDVWHQQHNDNDNWARARRAGGGYTAPWPITNQPATEIEVWNGSLYHSSGFVSTDVRKFEADWNANLARFTKLRFEVYTFDDFQVGTGNRLAAGQRFETVLTRPAGGWPVVTSIDSTAVGGFHVRYDDLEGLHIGIPEGNGSTTAFEDNIYVGGVAPQRISWMMKFLSPSDSDEAITKMVGLYFPASYHRANVRILGS